ncbi:unnamed protein product [Amoebophrya sp. A25]|nr:unnamed protein product [Amoebophrya sp. A25]|eukprot:GSA25T00018890001.1
MCEPCPCACAFLTSAARLTRVFIEININPRLTLEESLLLVTTSIIVRASELYFLDWQWVWEFYYAHLPSCGLCTCADEALNESHFLHMYLEEVDYSIDRRTKNSCLSVSDVYIRRCSKLSTRNQIYYRRRTMSRYLLIIIEYRLRNVTIT